MDIASVARESKALTSQRTPKGGRFMECSDLSELWILAAVIDGVEISFSGLSLCGRGA
jgi:hypothetical protein